MRVSCGDGAFCHSPGAVNHRGTDVRFGAPAGLDFDVRLACGEGESCDAQVERLRLNQHRTYRWRASIYDQVDKGFMPPPGQGHDVVAGSVSGAGYHFADGTPLPDINTPEGRRILRAWLGAGTPVVERFATGGSPGTDCTDGTVGDCIYGGMGGDGGVPVPVEPTWTSIYTQLVRPLCGIRCHAAGLPDFRGTTHLDLSTQRLAYDQMVGVAASGTTCAGAGMHVLPGDSANSLLVNLMGDAPRCGVKMPQGGPYLTAAQLAIVAQWVDAGAPDN